MSGPNGVLSETVKTGISQRRNRLTGEDRVTHVKWEVPA